jgi:hypothetical protein
VNNSTPISARSRRPASSSIGMAASSALASSRVGIRVLPLVALCFGPRTAEAGLCGTTWPTTSQSNSIRIAASCCFTVGAERSRASRST